MIQNYQYFTHRHTKKWTDRLIQYTPKTLDGGGERNVTKRTMELTLYHTIPTFNDHKE